MPADPPSNTGSSDRSRPTASELSKETTEGDLWNLDEESADRPTPQLSLPPTGARQVPEGGPSAHAAAESVQLGPVPPRPSERKSGPAYPSSEPPRDEMGDLDEGEPPGDDEESVVVVIGDAPEEAVRQTRPRATPVASSNGLRFPKLSPREWIALGSFAFLMALGVIWVITRFFTQLSFQSEHVSAPDFPVRGQHAAIKAADTFWREPIREGPNRDSAKREVTMIPVVEITLDPEASRLGALRISFKNERGETVGDPMIRSFNAGSFQQTGGSKIAVAATDGFIDEGNFNAYRSSDDPPWTVEVREGASSDGDSASFKPLTVIPILPLRR